MANSDKRKQSLYFADDMLNEIMAEAIRLDRSLSWLIQSAWRLASKEVCRFPSVDDPAALGAGPGTPDNWPAQPPGRSPARFPNPSQIRGCASSSEGSSSTLRR